MYAHGEQSRSPNGLNSARRSEMNFGRRGSSVMLRHRSPTTAAAGRTGSRMRLAAKQVLRRGLLLGWWDKSAQQGSAGTVLVREGTANEGRASFGK